jgi:hypothetical protein
MKEKMQLTDEALDDIVGGAFNQEAIKKYDLDVQTKPNGIQGLTVQRAQQTGSGSSVTHLTMPENGLRKYVDKYGDSPIVMKTTSGGWKTLTRSEVNELFS